MPPSESILLCFNICFYILKSPADTCTRTRTSARTRTHAHARILTSAHCHTPLCFAALHTRYAQRKRQQYTGKAPRATAFGNPLGGMKRKSVWAAPVDETDTEDEEEEEIYKVQPAT